ncbi:MAG TPA: glutathione S-transferase N-terminal domain-containing protein [Polyangiaceae bacterium]|nr:glutathione S-transferase N-terminal domain-containing protein [Polyangiaceae bacterium]
MTFVPKLYFSPGAVSMATHIALEEVQLPYALEPISIKAGEQLTERYRRVNPLGRLPALEIEPGVVLTETPALLGYLADRAPELDLLPSTPLLRARASELMSLLSSSVHVAFISFFRPDRYTADDGAKAALKIDGKQRFFDLLRHVDGRLPAQGYALGERYTLVDAYATVFFLWGRFFELPVSELERYGRLAAQVLERPAVRRALEQEGFGHLYAASA